AGFTA
ncbi:hypothetical protein D046_8220B, partial [Vibrio parahaemolyticus V-223/04]